MVAEIELDAKFRAKQIVARMAYDFIESLKPGDRFPGLQAEAGKHFDVGSEAYGLFIGCALHQMTRYVIDFDDNRIIVSIVRVKQ